MKFWPALDIRSPDDADLVLARLDDFAPTGIEERGAAVRAHFALVDHRDAARDALQELGYAVSAVDVSDEDWARRSQHALAPVRVGRIIISPYPESPRANAGTANRESQIPHPDTIPIVIPPSMGFGTGHHATTRLCLAALQRVGASGKRVLDVGTGSGILAIAAARLGATEALGIDHDPDAIVSANDNLALNPGLPQVRFEQVDLASARLPSADIVMANLTTALLSTAAGSLLAAVQPGGTLIVSGILAEERDIIRARYTGTTVAWADEEDGWLGFAFLRSPDR